MKFINKTLITILLVCNYEGNCSSYSDVSNVYYNNYNHSNLMNNADVTIKLPSYVVDQNISLTEMEYNTYAVFRHLKSYNGVLNNLSEEESFNLIYELNRSLVQLNQNAKQGEITTDREIILRNYMTSILDALVTEMWRKYSIRLPKLMAFMKKYTKIITDDKYFSDIKQMAAEFADIIELKLSLINK